MEQESEYVFICPHCWQKISMLLDSSCGSQKYIEDCEVCCQAIEIQYWVEDGVIVDFVANPAN